VVEAKQMLDELVKIVYQKKEDFYLHFVLFF
jgi:hypothetical protein